MSMAGELGLGCIEDACEDDYDEFYTVEVRYLCRAA